MSTILKKSKIRWQLISTVFALLLLSTGYLPLFLPDNPPPVHTVGPYNVHFIDIGQGDAILIDYGEFEILVDAGDNLTANRNYLINYLKQYVDGPLEYVVATHPHADHIGGMGDVFRNFTVGEFWHTADPYYNDTATGRNLLIQVDNLGVPKYDARIGDCISFEGLTLTVVSSYDPKYDVNGRSIVFLLEGDGVSMLLTGDAERPAELNYIQYLYSGIDILKLGHHGSRNGSSNELLDYIQPSLAIYTSKTGNSYGHPHIEAIKRLQDRSIPYFGTDVNGSIVIKVEAGTYTVVCQKSPSLNDFGLLVVRYHALPRNFM